MRGLSEDEKRALDVMEQDIVTLPLTVRRNDGVAIVTKTIIEQIARGNKFAERDYEPTAIAAIRALQEAEPNEKMMAAIWSMRASNTKDSFRECYRAMFDAILNEK